MNPPKPWRRWTVDKVLTSVGLVTYYVLIFIHLDTRRVYIAGITRYPHEAWMKQIARNLTMADWGFLEGRRSLIIDRDTKYTASFREILNSAGLKVIRLPPYSPNLNAFSERWVLSERNHQGLDNVIPLPRRDHDSDDGEVECQERLGGLFKFYCRKAA